MSNYLDCKPKNADSQLKTVKAIMLDGEPHSKYEIAEKTGIELSSVASRIRDLRLEKYGGYIIQRQKKDGVYYYGLLNPAVKQAVLF